MNHAPAHTPASAADLVADPCCIPHGVAGGGRVIFYRWPRQLVREETFLDERTVQAHPELPRFEASVRDTAQALVAYDAGAPSAWIFHTGFCGSTLLSRCLDRPRASLALREPQLLFDLAQVHRSARREPAQAGQLRRITEICLRLMTRRFDALERLVLKPSNGANDLIAPVVEGKFADRILLLYSGLTDALVSVLKRGETTRLHVRRLFQSLRVDDERRPLEQMDLLTLSDLQIAALNWHRQSTQFRAVLERDPGVPVRSLNFADLLRDPLGVLFETARFLQIHLSREEIHSIIAGPLFAFDSKMQDRSYSAADRASENAEIYTRNQNDIEAVVSWLHRLFPDTDLQSPLPHAISAP